MRGLLPIQVEALIVAEREGGSFETGEQLHAMGIAGQLTERGLVTGDDQPGMPDFFAAGSVRLTATGRMMLSLYRSGALP